MKAHITKEPADITPYVGCPMEKRFNDSCIDCTKHWLESEVDKNDIRNN